jgi:hypothetical protein
MSYSERERIEVAEEAVPELRIFANHNGARNGAVKGAVNGAAGNGTTGRTRLRRSELIVLGWEPRRRRLTVK